MLSHFLLGGSVGLFVYALRVQFMSDFGNIWIRPDQFGIRRFRPMNLVWMMVDTLRFPFMWKFSMIDVNWVYYFMIFGISGMLLGLHKKPVLIKSEEKVY